MASNNGGNIKKIMVNLDTLQTKTPKKTTRKNPPNIEPNRLKDTFMKQVQHYKSLANTKKQKQDTAPSKPLSAYTDEFNASVEYLNNIKKSVNLIQTELPTELIDDVPISQIPKPMLVHEQIETPPSSAKYKVDNVIPYGCLKNGIKQTLKNMTRNNRPRPSEPIKPILCFSPPSANVVSSSNIVPSSNVVPSSRLVPLEKTIIKRHVIGKSKKSRHVGVLIKNASTRKMITDEYKKLRKINISEVKTQLKNSLLQIPSEKYL